MTKSCVVCGKTLAGRQTKFCSDRECHRKGSNTRNRVWRQNNQEHLVEYRKKNKERKKETDREYRQDNREKIREGKHLYRKTNAEKIKEDKHKQYRRGRGIPEDWDLSRESSIEVIMRRWLQESDIVFVQHHYINLEDATKTHVDFFISPNICLYCDGDYWHGPKRPDIQERDARINKALERMGYIVIRLSESDMLAGVRPIEILETLCVIHAARH